LIAEASRAAPQAGKISKIHKLEAVTKRRISLTIGLCPGTALLLLQTEANRRWVCAFRSVGRTAARAERRG